LRGPPVLGEHVAYVHNTFAEYVGRLCREFACSGHHGGRNEPGTGPCPLTRHSPMER